MSDWQNILWVSAIVTAIAGGVVSMTAYFVGRRDEQSEAVKQKAHILFLTSYILMSLSIFFIAFRGLVG